MSKRRPATGGDFIFRIDRVSDFASFFAVS
jgi:hypothetical protein